MVEMTREQRVTTALRAHASSASDACKPCPYTGAEYCGEDMAADALEMIAAQQDYIALLHDRLEAKEREAAQTQVIRDWMARQMEEAEK